MANAISPKRGDRFVDDKGVPTQRSMIWIERLSSLFNTNVASVTDILDDHETRLVDHEDRLDAIELPRTISTQTGDYTIASDLESGVLADMASGGLSVTFPDATEYSDADFFVENVGDYVAWAVPEFGQTISGVDLIGLEPSLPYPICHIKSNGANWTLLSDRTQSGIDFAFYWDDGDGSFIGDENGDAIVF